MENSKFNIDDPENVNSFLARIGGSQFSPPREPSRTAEGEHTKPEMSSYEFADRDSVEPISRSQSITPQPARGTAAPHPTPATGAVVPDPVVTSLEPLEEDGSDILRAIANASDLNLNDSKYASKNYPAHRAVTNKPNYATMPTRCPPVMSFSNSFAPLNDNATAESPGKVNEHGHQVSKYQDDVVAKFLGSKLSDVEQKFDPKTEPFPVLDDTDTEPTIQASTDKVTQSTIDTPKAVNTAIANPTMVVTAATEDGRDSDASTEEDREHLKHFKSWGTPEPRNRPAARPRKIILHKLPADSDLTLAQSLVYGGAIETFSLSPTKTSAYVTFVSADACDAFFNSHPNGLVFKNPKTRRSHVVYVDRGLNVDVVSSVLQAYRECQASRVVRATGAEEDWGMGALYKLAEAKNRKVETIIDTYRDKVRTIIFRFTNIADGVGFHGQLSRDKDWEMCNVQFMIDPAEKATSIHLED